MPKSSETKECEMQQGLCSLLVDSASSETMDSLNPLMDLETLKQKFSNLDSHQLSDRIEGLRIRRFPSNGSTESFELWQIKLAISAASYCPVVLKNNLIESLRAFISSKIRGENDSLMTHDDQLIPMVCVMNCGKQEPV